MRRRPVIAVDGPAASGKGTIARALASAFRPAAHGYRPAVPRRGAQPVALGRRSGERVRGAASLRHARASTRRRGTAERAGVARLPQSISAYPSVRTALLKRQQEFAAAARRGRARRPRHRHGDRARRRRETVRHRVARSPRAAASARIARARHAGVIIEDVLADIRARDERDSTRAVAPLKPASDAIILDTSDLDREQAIAEAIRLVGQRLAKADAG